MTALGLMSGTSCDGVDAAIISTDGETIASIGASYYRPYSDYERDKIKRSLKTARFWPAHTSIPEDIATVERMITAIHAEAVKALIEKSGLAGKVDIIGFHGHTMLHRPDQHRTIQIGNAAALAKATGIDVVYDFRTADVTAGGHGAPLAALYHAARAGAVKEQPLLVVNIGGVSNGTWISGSDVMAFDTGPGNAPIDDWMQAQFGRPHDENGETASRGRIDEARIKAGLDHPFFKTKPPKSLDRNDFTLKLAEGLSPEDGAATLTAFTAAAIAEGVRACPSPPARVLVTGGGRHNAALMRELKKRSNVPVDPVEAVGWNGDMVEAEAFAFLAVRHLRGLPLSLPSTTGVPKPMPGGKLAKGR
ncbi:MAG: anhydro-N-acetylmuramic acid kinase [Alphaproteobacteria bacterium]